jgi:hypothetical protein
MIMELCQELITYHPAAPSPVDGHVALDPVALPNQARLTPTEFTSTMAMDVVASFGLGVLGDPALQNGERLLHGRWPLPAL